MKDYVKAGFSLSKKFIKKKLKSRRGILPILMAMAIGLMIGYLATDLATNGSFANNNGGGAVVVTEPKNVSKDDMKGKDIKQQLGVAQQFSNEQATKDLQYLKHQMASDLINYDIQTEGSLADIRVTVKGPSKIYGFSTFPLQVHIHAPSSTEPPENCVHIQKVEVWLETDDGRRWSYTKWAGNLVLRPKSDEYPDALGEDWDFNFSLKVPDPYVGKAKQMVCGTPNRDILEELLNAKVQKFEVKIKVEGYRELWRWEYDYDSEGNIINKRAVHLKDVDLDVLTTSLSAWKHLENGKYYIAGFTGSYPPAFAEDRDKTVPYAMYANGASSLVISRCWATPVHVPTSTADYQYAFSFMGNMEPIDITMTDDYCAVVFRLFDDGTAVIADREPGSFGEMNPGFWKIIKLPVYYKYDNRTVGYETYFVFYAVLHDHNGCGDKKDWPVWVVIKPMISVVSNKETILLDKADEIISILDDGKITESEAESLKNIVDGIISSLESKKKSADDFAKRCEQYNKEDAKKYAEKASEYYQKAIDCLNDLKRTNDPGQVSVLYKRAQNYEVIADYYYSASQKLFYGQNDLAKADIENAEKIIDDTKEYEPSIWFSAGSALGNAWQSFKEGLGFGWLPDWAIILIIVILVVGGAIIVFKIL
jgi:hypothetical protein